MRTQFVEGVRSAHDRLRNHFSDYREKMSEVLFHGEPISRSELRESKQDLVQGLRMQVDAVQRILFPAITAPETDSPIQPANLLAPFQDRLLSLVDEVDGRVDFFADPEGDKEDRNRAARALLKDLYRIDGLLNTYLDVLEQHCVDPGFERLDPDEREELLEDLDAVLPAS